MKGSFTVRVYRKRAGGHTHLRFFTNESGRGNTFEGIGTLCTGHEQADQLITILRQGFATWDGGCRQDILEVKEEIAT